MLIGTGLSLESLANWSLLAAPDVSLHCRGAQGVTVGESLRDKHSWTAVPYMDGWHSLLSVISEKGLLTAVALSLCCTVQFTSPVKHPLGNGWLQNSPISLMLSTPKSKGCCYI